MLASEQKRRIQQSFKALAEAHAVVAAQAEAAMADLERMLELDNVMPIVGNDRPIVDREMFSVLWEGKSCFLDNRLMFALFERLLRSVNRYVSYADLIDDVWEGQRSDSTIRGMAKRLRDQLASSGMEDLARAINSRPRHYGLMLV